MYRHRMFGVTDPRDKVYGTAALADDELAKKHMANIEYSVDPLVFYRRLSTDMLKTYPGLISLSVPPGLEPDHAEGLPSWVVDWRVTRKSPCVGLIDSADIGDIRFRASGDAEKSITFDETGSLLGLDCCWVDTIEEVGKVMIVDDLPHGYPGVMRMAKVSFMLDQWRAVTNAAGTKHRDYVAGGSIRDAFIQSLVGGGPNLSVEFMREQFSILDRQSQVIRWMGKLGGLCPKPAGKKYLVRLLGRIFNVPTTNVAFAFGFKMGPCADRTVFRTKKGYIGLATIRAAAGDRIAVPKGGRVPIVLRPTGDKWQMRADAYVHGIMDGEAFDVKETEKVWIT